MKKKYYNIVNGGVGMFKSVFAKYPSVINIKNGLYDLGAVYASMSGSGSAFFGIFKNECDIEKIKELFPDMFCRQWQL